MMLDSDDEQLYVILMTRIGHLVKMIKPGVKSLEFSIKQRRAPPSPPPFPDTQQRPLTSDGIRLPSAHPTSPAISEVDPRNDIQPLINPLSSIPNPDDARRITMYEIKSPKTEETYLGIGFAQSTKDGSILCARIGNDKNMIVSPVGEELLTVLSIKYQKELLGDKMMMREIVAIFNKVSRNDCNENDFTMDWDGGLFLLDYGSFEYVVENRPIIYAEI
tara:strand:+ start:1974 stop:2630 length:657 start_codon:yes stop_codon:yes gene_type:complete